MEDIVCFYSIYNRLYYYKLLYIANCWYIHSFASLESIRSNNTYIYIVLLYVEDSLANIERN